MTLESLDWEQRCIAKKAEMKERMPVAWRLKSIPKDRNVVGLVTSFGLLSAEEIEVTELDDVEALLQKLASGTWSAELVVTAFCKRAAIAHQLVNCLSEFWFEEAIERAQELDRIRAKSGPVGPLHGLPISLKDQFQIEGKECNMCFASWLGNISPHNSTLVDSLLQAGAVIHTRTGMAQGAWFSEGDNHVYGMTPNPYNILTVPGGSSSGEGALAALKGSAVGVGTDIGGSVRIPAAFNNAFGLRPTSRRLPYGRALNTIMGQEMVESVLGPMSSNLAGCVSFVRGVLASSPWDIDPAVVPIPWRSERYDLKHKPASGKLTIAYFDFDGAVHVHPPVQRAIQQTVQKLKQAGHEVIPWEPIDHLGLQQLCFRLFDADGGEDLAEITKDSGETLFPQIVTGKHPGMTVMETYKANLHKNTLRKAYLDRWQATAAMTASGQPIDAILCPIAPYAPPRHQETCHFGYTAVYNVLDLPAMSIPVTFVDPAIDPPEATYDIASEMDGKVKALYDPVFSAGSPIGVQLVGRRFEEEELLGMSKRVVEALKA